MLKRLWKTGEGGADQSGIVGTIIGVNEDDPLILRVKPDDVELQVAHSAHRGLMTDEVYETEEDEVKTTHE